MMSTHPVATNSTDQPLLPLGLASSGEAVIVRQIRGGRQLRQRLQDLGLNPGARVQIIQNQLSGPLIISVKQDGRLALGRGMAHHIMVSQE